MAVEIEHKYLVVNDAYKEMSKASVEIWQGYLSKDKDRTIRVRIKGNQGYITIKGITSEDMRAEFEYPISYNDARQLMDMCLPIVIHKTRYFVDYEGYLWEVDEFHDDLEGLIVAEIELPFSHHDYPLPVFVGAEVTHNPAYYNSVLSSNGLPKN